MLMTGGFQSPMQHLIQMLKRWQPEEYLFLCDPAATPSGLAIPTGEFEEKPWGAAALDTAEPEVSQSVSQSHTAEPEASRSVSQSHTDGDASVGEGGLVPHPREGGLAPTLQPGVRCRVTTMPQDFV